MTTAQKTLLTDLCDQITMNCGPDGIALLKEGESASHLLILWLQHIRTNRLTGVADCLVEGTASTAREAITCGTIGLVRPALNSLRLQIDLVMAWLYFKDHRIEWNRVQQTGDGFKLKTELFKYFADSFPRFQARYSLLKEIRTRSVDEPYRLLSAHVHGQNAALLPNVRQPADIVAKSKAQNEFFELQRQCSEYIGDILWSTFADSWASIPELLRKPLDARFKTTEQRASFFNKEG